MKIGKGVEWGAHVCAILALLPPDAALPGEALADFLDVPQPYLAKQLQALSRAGIVKAQRGAAGGYRLAKEPGAISLWDITAALEGTAPSFRCTEVRRNGPCGASPAECPRPCEIAAAFQKAEQGYRQILASVPLTDIVAGAAETATAERKQRINAWIAEHAAERA
ncbi:Rrf2 family transcriptional regulator [Alterisphingorhabdus coralli]|uniref:Rrf2 family transcriptional regulator n=1 Tax=Alterisphingorhabdus coralli TaxID=3071408 RepID=A0AA97FAA5_9SPHN|nr:Rrf2 family transcriptional regulator [Parasphingorhabdus sp. SCSIO 66989]WOE76461.1 Rrf2 family transcriptional regulator [Parasphingorhabdus sp. SCSIO 66989]